MGSDAPELGVGGDGIDAQQVLANLVEHERLADLRAVTAARHHTQRASPQPRAGARTSRNTKRSVSAEMPTSAYCQFRKNITPMLISAPVLVSGGAGNGG